MPKQDKPFDGGKYTYVFENQYKEQDSHPDFSGSNLIVNGEEKDVAIWHGVSKKTGAKYLSLQIKEPYKKGDAPQQGASQSEDPDLGF
jgi:uncharacterized protein (DUF736 family)|tara:strand:+ start:103 stop:366 length:264 start_codon:yes stop_codon:yes gene_type:complete